MQFSVEFKGKVISADELEQKRNGIEDVIISLYC
jgi:hypothetical protein